MMSRYNRNVLLALERQRYQCAEPSVAENYYRLIPRQMSLLEYFVRSRERLDEHRDVIGDRIGNRNQVDIGKAEIFREGAVATEYSEHRAIGTVPREAGGARRASAASGIDLANDAFSAKRGVLRFDHAATELMPRHSTILHVAARDLEVGAADAGD